MSKDLDTLERRVKRLESQNRVLRILWIVLVLSAIVTAARGQARDQTVIEGQKFELHDQSGHLRAELAILNGAPTLRFLDSDGHVQSLLGGDVFTIFSDKTGDNQATYGRDWIEFDNNRGEELIGVTAHEKDEMGKIHLNDYKDRIYTTVAPKDLEKLKTQ